LEVKFIFNKFCTSSAAKYNICWRVSIYRVLFFAFSSM
jgi:hypothetical protein